MATDDVLKATIDTLTASGLDVTINTEAGVTTVVVTDGDTGERHVVRVRDAWSGLVQAAEAAGFGFDG